MASLRRPSQFFGSKPDFSVPRPRAPRLGDPGRKRDARQSKVEEKMKTRRMSRYVRRASELTTDMRGQTSA